MSRSKAASEPDVVARFVAIQAAAQARGISVDVVRMGEDAAFHVIDGASGMGAYMVTVEDIEAFIARTFGTKEGSRG